MRDFYSDLFSWGTALGIFFALILTAQNQGAFEDVPQTETWLYRMAHAGSTTGGASADAGQPTDVVPVKLASEPTKGFTPVAPLKRPSSKLPQIQSDPEMLALAAAEGVAIPEAGQPSEQNLSILTLSTKSVGLDAPRKTLDEPQQMVAVTGSTVNLRAGPGVDTARVGQASRGDMLEPTGLMDGVWIEVRTDPLSTPMWIHGGFAELRELPAATAGQGLTALATTGDAAAAPLLTAAQ
ncbi:SH3 domain-containing protein [Oceanomicrobium pacificus]|uniref:SH3 domain-containing protein n=1 Tax=Oceanomicrobium pacificus TaxID=2692916 RepID=A0A6B0U051_9RHOB|nr:SH3 domain-containing protein [Oceanomicrobium pacificus]MXU64521.1 hypothetical protein [Oceanomicrobium pacificus]